MYRMWLLSAAAAFALLPGSPSFSQATTEASSNPRTPVVSRLETAAQAFLAGLDETQAKAAHMPFDSPKRTGGSDEGATPSFCAVLAWCPAQGVSQCDLRYDQRVSMLEMVRAGMTETGFQTVQNILNRQLLVGELEAEADTGFAQQLAEACPEMESDSIFDLPPSCNPDGLTMPELTTVGGAEPPKPDGSYELNWNFSEPPGVQGRYDEFCEYAVAVYGDPGTSPWAFRFEGHHVSVNITVLETDDGLPVLHATPLFLGSFPVVVPPASASDDLSDVVTWQQGQTLLKTPIDYAREIVAALPDALRNSAKLGDQPVTTSGPLSADAVPPWLSVSMLPDRVGPDERGAPTFRVANLGDDAAYHLAELYGVYLEVLPRAASPTLRTRVIEGLNPDATVHLLWDSKTGSGQTGNIYFYAIVGGLELEILAGNQWSVQSQQTPTANHIHSMLRDLNFDWTADAP